MRSYWYRSLLLVLAAAAAGLSACAAPAARPAQTWTLYAPASTSSIPVILAAEELPNVNLVLYTSQEQANTLFARGEAPMLVTGLSVGMDLYENGFPLQLANTYVSGLSFLVTGGEPVSSFAALKGRQVTVPFAGSPIEEVCRHLAALEGLEWGTDIQPLYAPFDSSIALLKEGRGGAVVLPEPNVSLVESQAGVHVSLDLYEAWNRAHPGEQGYPQVGTFISAEWAQSHAADIAAFNAALGSAITRAQNDPAGTVQAVKGRYKLPEAVLAKALGRTHYHLLSGVEMQARLESYAQTIGKPLDEKYSQFAYLPEE